ncbi:: hypothetical protein [Arcticibacter svalbardensis MN12-7]|uniref:PDZ domain-containing protein n=1 Tax=Arcticibacter svalbardensis MN12-7 TaxID=1150600 RepID=R9GP77_9SPHI|nr:hypothetical protein [Arcticibacter svalbardensis]EOR93528.1 : hypothetical protein [Arcticibacter svalbardensis MN12-7]
MKYILYFLLFFTCSFSSNAKDIYVAKSGNDQHSGSLNNPFATLYRAQQEARKLKNDPVNIYIRKGDYHLLKPLVFADTDSREAHAGLRIMPYKNENVTIKGSQKLDLKWKLKNGIYQAFVTDKSLKFDELYVNGKLMHMARYPNYEEGKLPFGGASADAISQERVKKWKNPKNAYLHAMQSSMWGGFSFLITGKENDSTLKMEGGWQNNRSAIHIQYRFVENVFEELDTLNEWFFNRKQQRLYLKSNQNPSQLVVETPQIEMLIEFKGNKSPVKDITLQGLKFSHTLRTFMKNKEPLLPSDWTIYRKGAITLENAENIKSEKCELTDLGGNAIVFSYFNKNNTLSGSHIYNVGSISPDLKLKAKKASIPKILPLIWKTDDTYDFAGVRVKNLSTLAERSATGMATETGVLVLDVSANSLMSGNIKPNDVILDIANFPIANIKNLVDARLNLQARKTAL